MSLRYAHVADQEVEAAAERVGTAIANICEAKKAHFQGSYTITCHDPRLW